MKRTPLTRKTPLKRGTSQLKRTALTPMSDRRRAVNKERAKAQEAAWGPRPWKCYVTTEQFFRTLTVRQKNLSLVMGPCYGEVNGHEILSRARAGRTDANLLDVSGQVPLCNRHNEWVETHPETSLTLGLARHGDGRDSQL